MGIEIEGDVGGVKEQWSVTSCQWSVKRINAGLEISLATSHWPLVNGTRIQNQRCIENDKRFKHSHQLQRRTS
jgi:hypothetical protein